MKIALIGNCQARGIERCIHKLAPSIDISTYHLSRIERADPIKDPLEQWLAEIQSTDVVICVDPLPMHLSVFTDEAIEQSEGRVVRFPYVATTAYQPDCAYIRNVPNHDENPMGPYHSVIAATGFCLGLSVERTEILFNKYVMTKLGFVGQFERKMRAFNSRAECMGYELSSFFSEHECNMHTINHPKIKLLNEIAKQSLSKAEIEFSNEPAPYVYDELADQIRWPVYPGIVGGVQGEFCFGYRDKVRGLRDFIEAEFKAFERAETPPENPEIARALPIIKAILVNS